MKILFLTNNLNCKDGWSRYSFDLVKEIQAEDNEVLCLVHNKSCQRDINEIAVLGRPTAYLVNPIRSFIASFRVSKIIRDFVPDAVYVLAEPYAAILPFIKKGDIKFLLTVHGTYSAAHILFDNFIKRTISKCLYRLFLRKIDFIISVSNFTKDHMLKYYPEVEDKIKVITNGIDLKHFPLNYSDLKKEYKIKKIICVGAVKPRKGILEAIEALNYYHKNISTDFVFNIVGSYHCHEDYFKKLLGKIKEYDMENNIKFKGMVDDEERNDLYRSSDLFFMPSINNGKEFEGYGLVYLEANSFGVPCIGANDSGAREAILNGRTGYTGNPKDKKDLAKKIDLILNKNTIKREWCLEWAGSNDISIKALQLLNLIGSGGKAL